MKLSVAMITYRHEKFIGRALDSVLSQKFDGELEIVVGDDASPDGTVAVIEEYQARHPGIIRLHQNTPNVGPARNLLNTLRRCSGDYIALLEGDDLWTDPTKLALQVRQLESRPDAAFSFHRVMAMSFDLTRKEWEIPDLQSRDPELTVEQFAKSNCVPTCSVVIRRSALPEWDEDGYRLKVVDWPFFLLVASRGPGLYIDREMGWYRLHAGGIHTGTSTDGRLRNALQSLEWVIPKLPPSAQSVAYETVARHHYCRILELRQSRKFPEAWKSLRLWYTASRRSGFRLSLWISWLRASGMLLRSQWSGRR